MHKQNGTYNAVTEGTYTLGASETSHTFYGIAVSGTYYRATQAVGGVSSDMCAAQQR
jgi:hypothetical protein